MSTRQTIKHQEARPHSFSCPTGMTVSAAVLSRREQKIARLSGYMSEARRKDAVGRTCWRWLGWAGVGLAVVAFGCMPYHRVRWGVESNTQYHFLLLCNKSIKVDCAEMAMEFPNYRFPAFVYDIKYLDDKAEILSVVSQGLRTCTTKDYVTFNCGPYQPVCHHWICSCDDGRRACSGTMPTYLTRGVHINCGDHPSCLVINRKEGMFEKYYRRSGDEYKKILDEVVSRGDIKPDEKMDVSGK